MEVRKVETNLKVEEIKEKVSLEYGPIVYAVEEIDNKKFFDAIRVSNTDEFQVQMEKGLLGGVNTLQNDKLKAIPYFAWSNRGIGKMKVWLPKNEPLKVSE